MRERDTGKITAKYAENIRKAQAKEEGFSSWRMPSYNDHSLNKKSKIALLKALQIASKRASAAAQKCFRDASKQCFRAYKMRHLSQALSLIEAR